MKLIRGESISMSTMKKVTNSGTLSDSSSADLMCSIGFNAKWRSGLTTCSHKASSEATRGSQFGII